MGLSGNGDEEQPASGEPDDRREAVGDRTMQLDALSDDIFEELDEQYGPPDEEGEGAADAPRPAPKPPPLPRRKRWTPLTIGALVGVVVLAAVLGIVAANVLFGGEEPDDRTAGAAAGDPAGSAGEETEGAPDVVPLRLDPVVIESGEQDEPAE